MAESSNLPEPAGRVPEQAAKSGESAGAKGKMTLSEIFSRSFEIYRTNPIIFVPSLFPIAWLIIGSIIFLASFVGFTAIFGGGGFLALSAIGGIFLFVIILVVLFILAEGVTIEMIKEASEGRPADLNKAWESSKGKMESLIVASVLAGIVIAIGYVLFIIPGIILTFVLYFVAQTVMIDGKRATESFKISYNFVKLNLADAVIIVLASMVISFSLPMIPVIGYSA